MGGRIGWLGEGLAAVWFEPVWPHVERDEMSIPIPADSAWYKFEVAIDAKRPQLIIKAWTGSSGFTTSCAPLSHCPH